ncbi:hypothetical protein CPC08DRAFT_674149, partial [Agrocybe pediades]
MARIRQRAGQVVVTVESPKGLSMQGAVKLAETAGRLQVEAEVEVTGPEVFARRGARLSSMTQSLLYKGIRERASRKQAPRRRTLMHLDITRHAAAGISPKLPTDEEIWRSLRKKDIAYRTRAFLWRVMHQSYKCGSYWDNIPGCQERGMCRECDTVDSVEHALTECRATGQERAWRLAEEVWLRQGGNVPWVRPPYGLILASSLADVRKPGGKGKLKGATRLMTILVTETAQVIWRMRCKWKITDEGDPEKKPSAEQVQKVWSTAIAKRFRVECLSTSQHRYGKKALKRSIVERTWWPVLNNKDSLQDDWIETNTGVLVG